MRNIVTKTSRTNPLVATRETEPPPPKEPGRIPLWVKGLAPLALLAVLVFGFLKAGPIGVFREAFPPVEVLTIQRIALPEPGVMQVHVINGGPEPVTVAQVFVDDASWQHTLDGERTIGRLQSRTITIPYPWVLGEPHLVKLVTSTGLTFEGEIAVATESPRVNSRYLATFAMLGVYVGVIPVLLGLLWLPFLRGIDRKWVDFFLSLTIGLLVFLAVDALAEALELSGRVAGAFQGLSLVVFGLLGTPLVIAAIGQWRRGAKGTLSPLYVSMLIALAIGLHNLGEGLAIGAAYSTGEISLGTFLVLGFLLHNTTEGLGIIAPIADERPSIRDLALLGLLAGGPTIIGTWVGGFTYSPVALTLFFAIGAGAIVQVVYELWKLFAKKTEGGLTTPLNAAGVLAGLAIMYVTGLLVTA
ncbi:MAG: ZIP family metal transporter [Gemmatimonadota bacterium]